jgi:hypothetical protein
MNVLEFHEEWEHPRVESLGDDNLDLKTLTKSDGEVRHHAFDATVDRKIGKKDRGSRHKR